MSLFIVSCFNTHYNFGWGGKCDGYYLLGTVDFSNALDEDFIDSEIGDISFANNAYYDYNFLTLIYQYRQ